jgi:hypothetical protein
MAIFLLSLHRTSTHNRGMPIRPACRQSSVHSRQQLLQLCQLTLAGKCQVFFSSLETAGSLLHGCLDNSFFPHLCKSFGLSCQVSIELNLFKVLWSWLKKKFVDLGCLYQKMSLSTLILWQCVVNFDKMLHFYYLFLGIQQCRKGVWTAERTPGDHPRCWDTEVYLQHIHTSSPL